MLKMHLQFFADDEEKKDDPVPSGEESTPPAGDQPAGEPAPTEQETPVTGDLTAMLLDIKGMLANIQQSLETPPDQEGETPPADDNPEETPPAPPEGEGDEEEPSEEEVKAIDEILQRN